MSRSFPVFLTSLIYLFETTQSQQCIPPPQNLFQKLNFTQCLLIIQNMSVEERGASGCFNGNLEEGVLSLEGCIAMCGPGYDLWEWSDTFNRLSLLVLPTLFLIAHLAFPAAGWQSYLIIPCHAIGNPIGSLRSLLTRLEMHRRLSRKAEEAFSNSRVSVALATVAAAYEEFGWQRISTDLGPLTDGQKNAIIQASHDLSMARPASTFRAMIAILTLVGTLATAIVRTVKQMDQNDTRVSNETAHTIAVVIILFITIPQVWFSARLGTFTTNSGAIHTLRTLDQNLMGLSLVAGRQTSLFPPLQLAYCQLLPQQRSEWLVTSFPKWTHQWTREFFSHCPLPNTTSDTVLRTTQTAFTTQTGRFRSRWQAPSKLFGINANYLGINSFWRPCKHLPPNEHGRGQRQIMVTSIFWIIFGSGLPALFLSATNHTDRRRIGVGCRSLSWIGIMALWLFSFIFDSIIRFCYCHASAREPYHRLKLIYRWTVLKDALATIAVIILVLLVQMGRYNSCWCRASFSHPPIIDLMPYTDKQWMTAITLWAGLPSAGLGISLVLILWIEFVKRDSNGSIVWFQKEHGSPLCKNGKALDFEFRELGNSEGSGDLEEHSKEPQVRDREFSIGLEMGQLPTIPESESLLHDARIAAAYCRD
ncbi:hypothetical protein OIDMADRAFT_32100 [Oidiodendron maius Zn]|uniref:Uncharacterized protein n=1 Tax=Oidiodendron maius (strain Zn) TaxID=913774 RepID=A0A0C3D594_OIDMZ|nr:hypothetical protein OIDMADRAFT_32100 [Oidiodendron maius Zn]